MPPISLMIKPVSGSCNMGCSYCFYNIISQERERKSYGSMDRHTLEQIVRSSLEHAEGWCEFTFQGGEPTLAGLEFYTYLVQLVSDYNLKRIPVYYALQTNGILLDTQWATLFRKYGFLVGLSLDGPKDIHDLHRFSSNGASTYAKTMRAAQLLQAHRVPFSILSVITEESASRVGQIYGFFKRNNFSNLQFIPRICPPAHSGESLSPEAYSRFLSHLFSLWYCDLRRGQAPTIRYFDDLLLMLQERAPGSCMLMGECTRQFVIEADGTAFPCDFYTDEKYSLGNICEDSFPDLNCRRAELGFIKQSVAIRSACKNCQWWQLCRGGCFNEWNHTKLGLHGNQYCEVYSTFLAEFYPKIARIIQKHAAP